MTLQEWLDLGEAQLRRGPHPERARRDAEMILLHVIRRERAAMLARWKEKLDVEEAALLEPLFLRRMAGEPIQYILGQTEFYGLPFRVTADVLIPRPETEHLVEKVLELAQGFHNPRIVDVGCGSGAIAVALARALPHARISATDLSSTALTVARENAERNQVAGRIRFLRRDLLEPLGPIVPTDDTQFEIVVSNPPYVPLADRDSLAVEVREYEPALALFAGDDGLDVYRRLIPAAYDALIPGGFLALEIGYGQSPAIRALLFASGFHSIDFFPDLQNIPRVAVAQRL
jgi:release factor glutamine methyltransferase